MRRIEVRDVRLLLLAIHFVSLFLIPKFPADMDFRLICPFSSFPEQRVTAKPVVFDSVVLGILDFKSSEMSLSVRRSGWETFVVFRPSI